jgi:hypothetical protein
MNRNLKSVSQFLSMYENSERFSSADGSEYYGTFEGDDHFGTFSPEDLTSADGGMGAGRKPTSKPYVLQVYATGGTTVNAILFGFNDNFSAGPGTAGQGAYGNNIAINVASAIPGVSYERLITQSQNKPFDIGLWRFSCGTPGAQLDVTMTITYVDANGRTCTDPVPLSNYKDAYQQQNTIIDVWYPVKIDGNTYITLPITGATTTSTNPLTISMFPRSIADQANQLVGGGSGKSFTTPRLSGRNVPVIQMVNPGAARVNTVQGVSLGKTM